MLSVMLLTLGTGTGSWVLLNLTGEKILNWPFKKALSHYNHFNFCADINEILLNRA